MSSKSNFTDSYKSLVAQGYDILNSFLGEYRSKTTRRVQMLDVFIIFAFVTSLLQYFYMARISDYPYNSYLSSVLASLGFGVLTVALRLQLTNPREFGNLSPEAAFASYIFSNLVLFFAVVTFMG